ncbi:MAG: hypothetical protein N2654_04600, partial [Deltaproteobacteria bacterium]|nr:hypothetical protein [Deltaproteobacteria bacterium]
MVNFTYNHVEVYDFEFLEGPIKVSSEDLEAELGEVMPKGTLERLTGISTRTMWPRETFPSDIAAQVAEKLLNRCKDLVSRIDSIINFSVSRDFFEPATSVIIHRKLGLKKSCLCFDISNACIGFSNALSVASAMIESGKIECALLVAGETVRGLVESTIDRLKKLGTMTREQIVQYLPVLTLGSGAVAYLVTRRQTANKPYPIASACESSSEFSDLCEGNGDFCIADYVFDKINKLADKAPIMRT